MNAKSYRLLVNGRFRLAAHASGVQRYAEEITRRLADRVQMAAPPWKAGQLSGQAWEQFVLPVQARSADLLWSPANTGPLAVRRQAATLHDAAAIEHPEWFAPAFAAWYRFFTIKLAHRAQRIFTVSRFSKERLTTVLHLLPEKIEVIYPGVGAQFRPTGRGQIDAVRSKYGLGERYFLWVGTIEPRKNLGRLLTAWRRTWQGRDDLCLALCGAVPNRQGVFRGIPLPDLPSGVVAAGFANDEDLPPLYSGALALLMPSLYEGFGLPALEAAACETPALVSQAAGVLEALNEAAIVVDPHDINAVAAALERLANDESWRRELGHRAALKAAAFTWERSAEAVYRALIAAVEQPASI